VNALAEHRDNFRAMDTDIDVSIYAAVRPLAAFASVRILFEQQEARFSRFRPSSLLSSLNRGAVVDDALFAEVCRLALEASALTGGLFNPMVLPALEAAGYDRTFRDVQGGEPSAQLVPRLDECVHVEGNTVQLLAGKLDLGGIVKGWTVDKAAELLLAECDAVLINAGGDMRTTGHEPGVDGWHTGVAGPAGGLVWQGLLDGALATSTVLRRRWATRSGAAAHHLIDPRTALPAQSSFVQVSAWATETWLAECWAKAVLIGGPAAMDMASGNRVRVLALDSEGGVHGIAVT